MKKWTRSSFSRGPPALISLGGSETLPPGVIAARERLGWGSGVPCQADVGVEVRRERSPLRREEGSLVSLTDTRLVLHSGETLTRPRIDAPWAPADIVGGRRQRGSLQTAVDIASNLEMLNEACEAYDALVYAPGMSASKNALFATWRKVSEAQSVQPLPLTVQNIKTTVAVLRSAGYRAIRSFLYEAKDRHIRSGFGWSAVCRLELDPHSPPYNGLQGHGATSRKAGVNATNTH